MTRDHPALASEVVTLYMTNLPRPPSVPRTGEPNPATVGSEHRVSLNNIKSQYSFGFDGRSEAASPYFVYQGLAPSLVGVCQLTIRVPPVKARQDMSIGYVECLFTHGVFLPCLGPIAIHSETKLPVAPAE